MPTATLISVRVAVDPMPTVALTHDLRAVEPQVNTRDLALFGIAPATRRKFPMLRITLASRALSDFGLIMSDFGATPQQVADT